MTIPLGFPIMQQQPMSHYGCLNCYNQRGHGGEQSTGSEPTMQKYMSGQGQAMSVQQFGKLLPQFQPPMSPTARKRNNPIL